MKKLILGLLVFASTSAFALDMKPNYISCVLDLNGNYNNRDFKLSTYTKSDGSIDMNETIQIGQRSIEILAFRHVNPDYSGTIKVRILEPRGVYSDTDICAGGGCPPAGTPKTALLLESSSNWESGKYAKTSGYSGPNGATYFSVSCFTKE